MGGHTQSKAERLQPGHLLQSPTSMPTADPSSFPMFLELHVEQGKIEVQARGWAHSLCR